MPGSNSHGEPVHRDEIAVNGRIPPDRKQANQGKQPNQAQARFNLKLARWRCLVLLARKDAQAG
jgi:hypothetical protein